MKDLELLGVMPTTEAERLYYLLTDEGIKVERFFNSATCSSGGCGSSTEVWIKPEDRSDILKIIEDDHARKLSHHESESLVSDSIYDPSNPTAVCPACSHEFSTTLTECPDCGLNFL